MNKIIELALKSGEITLQGVINLVNCIDEELQERAVMLLTENNNVPEGINILDKGFSIDSNGDIIRTYQCVGYNYLKNEVVARVQTVDKNDDYIMNFSVGVWNVYRQNYIEHQQKEREEYLKKQQEQQ